MDSDAKTWTMDPVKTAAFLEQECEVHCGALVNHISKRRVRALLPVHLYGHPADLDPRSDLTARYPGLVLIEDAFEALGLATRVAGSACAAWPDVSSSTATRSSRPAAAWS